MLCTRIRLAERRYSARKTPDNTFSVVLPGSSLSSKAKIQRPCVLRTLETNCAGYSNNSSTNSVVDNKCIKMKTKEKSPLIIFSLNMQPGTKTLVQHDVKRDPKKQPAFCENYKQNVKRYRQFIPNNDVQEKPISNLFVQGFEIVAEKQTTKTSQNNENLLNNDLDNLNYFIPDELKVQLTDCCQCILDICGTKDYENMETLQNEFDLKSVPSNYLNPNQIFSTKFNDTEIWINEHHSKVSPRTKQIIDITMNSRKISDTENQEFKEI